jgi:hypothetical protein
VLDPNERGSSATTWNDEGHDEAKRLGVQGRSTMNKAQLSRAVSRKRS